MLNNERRVHMKILVLGNGFDLDHNLPTSYSDFLNFCNCVLSMDTTKYAAEKRELKESQIPYICKLESDADLKLRFTNLLKNNHLLNYFNIQKIKTGKNWIDLEREIKSIISEFRVVEAELKKSNQSTYALSKEHKIQSVLRELGLNGLGGKDLNAIKLAAIHYDLCVCLDRLSRALEMYIYNFINQTDVTGTSPDIIGFDANRVLTFNYSDTYERVYGGIHWNGEVDHIHGSAKENAEDDSNIILGVTSDSGISSEYVEFEKYFQRITKQTTSNYKKWLDSKLGKKEKIEISFFGHSLDATDGDVIKDMVMHESSLITIFYYDKSAYKQIVANLIEIIGKDNLVDFVYGERPKIRFVKQQEHHRDSTAGLEITRDIRKLYRLYELSKEEITTIIEKIKKKVDLKDQSYFYSQSKVISIFEALRFHNIISKGVKKFAEICYLLDYELTNKGRLKYYDEQEWCDYEAWGEEIPCDALTVELIALVNADNKKRYDQAKSLLPYYDIMQKASAQEIKDALLEAFKIEKPTVDYWKQLDQLINSMPENKLLEDALELINKEDLPLEIRARFKHFSSEYWRLVFNIQYNRQMMEEYEERKKTGEEDI